MIVAQKKKKDKAFNDLSELKEFVSGRTYKTATRGQRSLQDCRIFVSSSEFFFFNPHFPQHHYH